MAGFWGGRRDEFLMRIMDALFAFPSILLALIILVALADSGISRLLLVSIAIGIPFVPTFARLIRGSTLSVKEQEYVIAAQSMGATDLRVASRHIFPNTLAPIIVQASLLFGVAVIVEAALSFLGLGTQPPEPSWGIMLAQSQRFMRTGPGSPSIPASPSPSWCSPSTCSATSSATCSTHACAAPTRPNAQRDPQFGAQLGSNASMPPSARSTSSLRRSHR